LLIPILFFATVRFVERSRNLFLSLGPLFYACFNSQAGKALRQKREHLQGELRVLVELVCATLVRLLFSPLFTNLHCLG